MTPTATTAPPGAPEAEAEKYRAITDPLDRARAMTARLAELQRRINTNRAARDNAIQVLMQPWEEVNAEYDKTVRAADAEYEAGTITAEQHQARLAAATDARTAARRGVPWKPADVWSALGVSRALLVRIRNRAAGELPPEVQGIADPAGQARKMTERVKADTAVLDALRAVRDDTIHELNTEYPEITTVEIGELLAVTPVRITQKRTGNG